MIRWSSYQFSARRDAPGRSGSSSLSAWRLAVLASLAAWIGAGACLAPDAQQGMAAASSATTSSGTPGGTGGSGNQGGGGSGQGGGGAGVGGEGGGSPLG